MELNIEKQNKNELLDRLEILAVAKTDKTPKNQEVKEEIAKLLNSNPENVRVRHIYSGFGIGDSYSVEAYVYDNLVTLKKIEEIQKVKKSGESGEVSEGDEGAKGSEGAKGESKAEEVKEKPAEKPKVEEKSDEKEQKAEEPKAE